MEKKESEPLTALLILGYKNEAKTQPEAKGDSKDDELDAELLRRLMVKLGVADKRAKEIIAAPISQKRAEIKKEADGSSSARNSRSI